MKDDQWDILNWWRSWQKEVVSLIRGSDIYENEMILTNILEVAIYEKIRRLFT